jgi:hypothetical protein
MKSMSDGEVNDYVFKKLMGDMDHIEAAGMFDEHEPEETLAGDHAGTKVEAHGVSVHIKPMNGEQTQDRPEFKEQKEEQEGEFGL